MAPEPFNRLVRATVVSIIGLREAYQSEPAFRQELLVLLLLIPTAWVLTSTGMERALLNGSWMLVIVIEMLNSAIEAAVNRIGNERHELSRKAKDFGSAAVFCSILLSIAVWILVLFP
ncbi:MAG TPA: diacylglycerol kinase [Candidatus Binatia bacterium]|nr:diacylglycerol kinase [Candidatus Binatia bacterium]